MQGRSWTSQRARSFPLRPGWRVPNHPPGPVRRPILGAAVAGVLVVGESVLIVPVSGGREALFGMTRT